MAWKKPKLTKTQILKWADAHHKRTGQWPKVRSGAVVESPEITWSAIVDALWRGGRGLSGGTTLPQLLAKHRNVRNRHGLPRLTIKQVLIWADAHRRRTGEWPQSFMGTIPGTSGETWSGVGAALRKGSRGFSRPTSLAKLLTKHRDKPHKDDQSRLTLRRILAWADAHHRRTGRWPKRDAGPVHGVSGEGWDRISGALGKGCRGLPGGSSLARLLAKHRGVRNTQDLPRLTIKQILKAADDHKKRTGGWPKQRSGVIGKSQGDTWMAMDDALFQGHRGLRGGQSLAQLLDKHRGVRNHRDLAILSLQQILRWADAHHRRTGNWPTKSTGRIPECRGQTWSGVHAALYRGLRGLRGGSTLLRLLAQYRGVRNTSDLPRLTKKQILEWVDGHCKRERSWPNSSSGPIPRSGGETWAAINQALVRGRRGMPAGGSLAKFLNKHRRPERGL